MAQATRFEIDDKTVATLRKIISTKRGRQTMATVRHSYNAQMEALGFDMMTAYHGFNDCADMAVLENEAA